MGGVKDNIKDNIKTNKTKDYSKPMDINNVYGCGKEARKPNIKKQSEDRIIKDLRNVLDKNK